MKYFSEGAWFSCHPFFVSTVNGAAVHAVAHRVPVCQLGVQLARPVRQLQQRHLVSEPLQRVGGFRHRAALAGPPAVPSSPAGPLPKLHLQRLGRADPQGEQDPSSLQRVREEQPPQARAAASQPLHPAANRPAGSAAQTPPAAHWQHETGRNCWPASPQTQISAQEGVPTIGASSGALGGGTSHTGIICTFLLSTHSFLWSSFPFHWKTCQSETDQTKLSRKFPFLCFLEGMWIWSQSFFTFSFRWSIRRAGSVIRSDYGTLQIKKNHFDMSTNLRYMYIGINENCFRLKYWKQSFISESCTFFFFNNSVFVCCTAKKGAKGLKYAFQWSEEDVRKMSCGFAPNLTHSDCIYDRI